MIVQVCPPGTGGVRDYADALARAWSVRDVASQLIEGTPGRLRPALDALLPAGGNTPLHVVLHFSGYGYAPRGLCGWLADDLAAFKTVHAERVRLVVVFHELFATGAPWRSAFWLAPWQSQVARRLARLADGLWTNTGGHARWLHEATGGATPLRMRPVFSNVGEPVDPPVWAVREPRAIVFGSAETRARAFADLRAGVHYINARASFDADAEALALMALRLHRWYGAHSLALQSHQLLQAATAPTPAPALA